MKNEIFRFTEAQENELISIAKAYHKLSKGKTEAWEGAMMKLWDLSAEYNADWLFYPSLYAEGWYNLVDGNTDKVVCTIDTNGEGDLWY